jgi:hypothetical protein
VVPLSSLKPLVGKVSHILKQLKINLLDMDAALPDVALRPSKAQLDRRQAWRAFVKSSATIFEVCLIFFILACRFLHYRTFSHFKTHLTHFIP